MKDIYFDNRFYLQSEKICDTKLVSHGFTGSQGGVSNGIVRGLNLGFRVQDNPENVIENYKLVSGDLELLFDRIVLSKQTHTDNIRIVTEDDAGKGISKISDIEDTDGLITNVKGIPLVVFSADCVPLLFLDPVHEVVGAVHAGWRGTVKGIGRKCVGLMKEKFGSKAEDILVAVGPSIGPCCFEFGKADAVIFSEEFCREMNEEKVLVDIWGINKKQLTDCGIPEENIDVSGVCTVCNSDKYYSYRTHREKTGRQGAIIMLKRGI